MTCAARTDKGRRLCNEDSLIMPEKETAVQMIAVADGMGGHAAGKRASTLAVDGLLEELGDNGDFQWEEDPVKLLRSAIKKVNQSIYLHAKTEEGCRGMGTTLALALLFDDCFIAANVGDSRIYHFDGWSLDQVTHDHSLVAVLVASGEISLAESYIHPHRNIITRALGTSEYEEADYFQRKWVPGDILLACSDGLHGSVKNDKIESILREQGTPEQYCELLVDAALKSGATDNITVVLAQHTGGGRI